MIPYTPKSPVCGTYPVLWLLDLSMRDFFEACEGGLPEAPLINWAWEQYGNSGGVFVDIGAHVGTWAVPFATAGMPTVAYEPNPMIRERLLASSIPGLTVRPFAVADRHRRSVLTAPGIDGGMASIVREFVGPVNVPVDVISLDAEDLTNVRLMKIDVEGAELDVLRGAKETINRWKPTIIFECWTAELGQRIPELFQEVSNLGYAVTQSWWPETWVASPK